MSVWDTSFGGSRSAHLVLPFTSQQDRLFLGMPTKKLDMVIYYERYVLSKPGIARIGNYLRLLTEEEYLDILDALPKENQMLDDMIQNKFIAKMGADAFEDLLARFNLDKLSYDLRLQAATETSQQRKQEALKAFESRLKASVLLKNRSKIVQSG